MTAKELEHIKEIEGTAGFRIIVFTVSEKMKKLDSVRGIVKDGLVAEQALARQLAYEILEEFLSDLNLISKPEKVTNKTYE